MIFVVVVVVVVVVVAVAVGGGGIFGMSSIFFIHSNVFLNHVLSAQIP